MTNEMRAIKILGPSTSPTPALTTHPIPTPTDNQVLIRVHAAGLTADEVTWPELYHLASRIPGHDISGVVASLSPTYTGPLKVGSQVYAMLDANGGEGQAEYVLASPDEVALKPRTLSHAEASALPIPAVTAYEGLLKHAGLEEGMRVLVTGASGAVGVVVVQLAKILRGAEVVGLASAEKAEFLRGLGVNEVVDYREERWEGSVGTVDVVFDTVGGDVLKRAWALVKSGGIVVTVGPPAEWAYNDKVVPEEATTYPGVRYKYFIVSPDREALGKIAAWIDEGRLKTGPVVEFPVERGVEAWGFAGRRGRSGKTVINFVTEEQKA
ncbi:hypothetical protein OQA88_5633 [Cercophora sp. LCS_1]